MWENAISREITMPYILYFYVSFLPYYYTSLDSLPQ